MADNTNISDYKDDPFGAYNFWVEVNGMSGIKARFSEVSGLKGDVEEYEIKEGGLNYRTHLIPGRVKWGPITLKKGLTTDEDLEKWWAEIVQNKAGSKRKTVKITLLKRDMTAQKSWNLRNAWIKSWQGTTLNGGGSEMAIETFVLNHEGVTEWTGESG